ncbi:MAG: DUF4680 domain-containing protein, partial [Gemmatimonadetes bacterium]|nr:DUF4680 domain-containing protein [Gemmatimonadota bacterium]
AALGGARGAAEAQEGALRVEAMGDGTASFVYPVQADVEVCDHGVRMDGGRMSWGHVHTGEPERCSRGEARVVLRVAGGTVTGVELGPSGGEPPAGRDLGVVAGPDAADFLLSLAWRGATADAAADAIPAAALARDAEAWPGMLDIARDRDLGGDLRQAALFWVSRAAAEAVTGDLADIARDAGEAQDVKNAAVFALSRRPVAESVAALMEIARDAPERETRRTAMFWLARLDDPRVVPFFEAILSGRAPSG